MFKIEKALIGRVGRRVSNYRFSGHVWGRLPFYRINTCCRLSWPVL
jgi:hypothetical protein